jgi:hypothetical protein
MWCHLNDEANLLEQLLPNGVQVSGSMTDEMKEERLVAFQDGQIQHLITKPKIGCFGLNWQHCHNVATFPSHSWEQYYQSVRRCWRFGQSHEVSVHIVVSDSEVGVLRNLQDKADKADRMFASLNQHMNHPAMMDRHDFMDNDIKVPEWMANSK